MCKECITYFNNKCNFCGHCGKKLNYLDSLPKPIVEVIDELILSKKQKVEYEEKIKELEKYCLCSCCNKPQLNLEYCCSCNKLICKFKIRSYGIDGPICYKC